MRLLAALWTKEWLALARDVHGLAVLFLMPAAFVVVMSLALTDAFQPSAARPATFTILGGSSPLAARLADSLAGEGFRAVPAPADEMAAREQLRRGSLALAVLLASGFDSSPGPGSITVLADPAVDAVQLAAFRRPPARAGARWRGALRNAELAALRGRGGDQPRGDRLGAAGRGVRAHARAGDGDRRCRQHPRRGARRHHGAALPHAADDADARGALADGVGARRLPCRAAARERFRRDCRALRQAAR